MATLISIGFVELLKWISGLLTSARVVLNALVNIANEYMGSQWVVFISTHLNGGVRMGASHFISGTKEIQ